MKEIRSIKGLIWSILNHSTRIDNIYEERKKSRWFDSSNKLCVEKYYFEKIIPVSQITRSVCHRGQYGISRILNHNFAQTRNNFERISRSKRISGESSIKDQRFDEELISSKILVKSKLDDNSFTGQPRYSAKKRIDKAFYRNVESRIYPLKKRRKL